nr:Chain C, HeV2 [Henipavirus hendraense]6J2F_F Chain F, HeV2 [Henipavirus hendraense]
DYINTNVLP